MGSIHEYLSHGEWVARCAEHIRELAPMLTDRDARSLAGLLADDVDVQATDPHRAAEAMLRHET